VDTTSEIRLQSVCPALADKVRLVDAEFQRQTDDHLEIVQGLRSWNQQQTLWLKGRDADGNIVDEGQVVTNARPGHSWHEFAMAVDCVPRSLLTQLGWNPESPLWATITAIAESYGLTCGACWMHKDLPHLQLTGKFGVSPTDEVRQIFKDAGMAQVWKESGVLSA
jgi:peptidoglycan LD-endopeptidase CwlK